MLVGTEAPVNPLAGSGASDHDEETDMPLPTDEFDSYETEGSVHWYGRCDGCGKRRFFMRLYDCFRRRTHKEEYDCVLGAGFQWQCAPCMVVFLAEKYAP